MSFLINVDHSGLPLRPVRLSSRSAVPGGTPAPSSNEDSVEFSTTARQLAAQQRGSSARIARIQAIRQEIAAGTYETTDRLQGTVSVLLDVLG